MAEPERKLGLRPHVIARTQRHASYPPRNGGVPIPDDQLSWSVPYVEYRPTPFTAPVVLANWPDGWADPPSVAALARPPSSYAGPLAFDTLGRPLNPAGRTGISERGVLGRWGANFAADPIVTRYNPDTGVLEGLFIRRKDSGLWAIPGGMVDEGEEISETLAREFLEEAGVALDMSDAALLYRGYVDDPRNTDHAWMETTVKHKHLSSEFAASLRPHAGDDASEVMWMALSEENLSQLYANHAEFVRMAKQRMDQT